LRHNGRALSSFRQGGTLSPDGYLILTRLGWCTWGFGIRLAGHARGHAWRCRLAWAIRGQWHHVALWPLYRRLTAIGPLNRISHAGLALSLGVVLASGLQAFCAWSIVSASAYAISAQSTVRNCDHSARIQARVDIIESPKDPLLSNSGFRVCAIRNSTARDGLMGGI
jgi:hypothetical protein